MPSGGLSVRSPHMAAEFRTTSLQRHHSEWKPYARSSGSASASSNGGSVSGKHAHGQHHHHHHQPHHSAAASRARRDEYRDVLTEDLPPLPPSLSEILATFSKYGNGDRKMLLTILRAKQAEEDRLADIIQTRLSILKDRARYMQTLSPPLSAVHTPGTTRSTPSPQLPGIHAALATSRQVDEMHERRGAGGRVELPPPSSAAAAASAEPHRRSSKSSSSHVSVISELVDGRSPGALTRRALSDEGWREDGEHARRSRHGSESKAAISPKAPGLEMLLNAVQADGQ